MFSRVLGRKGARAGPPRKHVDAGGSILPRGSRNSRAPAPDKNIMSKNREVVSAEFLVREFLEQALELGRALVEDLEQGRVEVSG